MGDEKHGLLRVCRKQTAVQFALGGFVERAADLIEQEDVPYLITSCLCHEAKLKIFIQTGKFYEKIFMASLVI